MIVDRCGNVDWLKTFYLHVPHFVLEFCMIANYDKEILHESFRNSVFRDYAEYQKKSYFGLLQIIGETIGVSQDAEMELAEKAIEYSKIKPDKLTIETDLALDRMNAKDLIDKLDEYGFFNEIDKMQRNPLIRKLKSVIECRNWLIHTSIKEWENKKQDNDTLFQIIAKSVGLFKENTYADLEQSINQNWQNKNRHIDFNIPNQKLEVSWISSRTDWVAVKAIMTKHLLYELRNRLNKNQLSIYV